MISQYTNRRHPRFLAETTTILAIIVTSIVACSESKEDPAVPEATGGSASLGGMGGDQVGTPGTGGDSSSIGEEGGASHEDCFAPSKTDDAYVSCAVGCTCDGYHNKSICIGGAALFCDESVWGSGEDGPCEIRTDDCAGITDDWQKLPHSISKVFGDS